MKFFCLIVVPISLLSVTGANSPFEGGSNTASDMGRRMSSSLCAPLERSPAMRKSLLEEFAANKAFSSLSPDTQRVVSEFIERFVPDSMKGWQKARLLQAGARIQDHADFESFIKRFIEPDISDRAIIIHALSYVMPKDRPEFLDCFEELITADMDQNDKAKIAMALAYVALKNPTYAKAFYFVVTSEERGIFMEQIRCLIDNIKGRDRTEVMTAFLNVHPENRAAFIEDIQRLTSGMDFQKRVEIIHAVVQAYFSINDIKISDLLSKWISPVIKIETRSGIIIATCNIVLDRESHAKRACQEIDLPEGSPNFLNRFIQLLQTPLNQPIPPLGGMGAIAEENGYGYGVDVHAFGREDNTTQAFALLIKAQQDIAKTDFDAAYQNFLLAIDAIPNEVIKLRVKKVLGLKEASASDTLEDDIEDDVPEGAGHLDEFGSLLSGPVASYGLAMTPKEFLGRLWHFVSFFRDPRLDAELQRRDQENLRASMISGLADSIEEDGRLVCNPGKLQRMAISLLQGRLEGVRIDDLEEIEELEPKIAETIDQVLHGAICTEGSINKQKAYRLILSQNIAPETSSVYRYIGKRVGMIASLAGYPELKRMYANKEDLEGAKAKFLEVHTDIKSDPLLKALFEYQINALLTEVDH